MCCNAHLDTIKGSLGVKYVNCNYMLHHQPFLTAVTHKGVKV
jgi:hypothetical protein